MQTKRVLNTISLIISILMIIALIAAVLLRSDIDMVTSILCVYGFSINILEAMGKWSTFSLSLKMGISALTLIRLSLLLLWITTDDLLYAGAFICCYLCVNYEIYLLFTSGLRIKSRVLRGVCAVHVALVPTMLTAFFFGISTGKFIYTVILFFAIFYNIWAIKYIERKARAEKEIAA